MNGQEIKQLRTSMGLTQEMFARMLGVSWTTVCRWENNASSPSPLALDKLGRVKASHMRKDTGERLTG